jgi:CRP-like cAMP-binding protein
MLSSEDVDFYASAFKDLDPGDLAGLFQVAQTRTLAAGAVYIRHGSISSKIAFIRKGLIRAYFIKENDEEITLMVRWENQFVASLESIMTQKPSRYTFQALEETVLIELDYSAVRAAIDTNPSLSASRNRFLMHMLSQAMDRIEGFVILSPEERYRKLLAEKTDIVNRVPDKYLATMLGITPVSLSRIRKRMTANPRH